MANVIIPTEHQAAPNVAQTPTQVKMAWREGEKHSEEWWKSYDEEMTPVYDEQMKREMAELRYASKTSEEAVEEMMRRYEENYTNEDTKKQRWSGQERWQGKENEAMRRGQVLHVFEFMEKLRRAGVDARIDSPTQLVWTENDEGRLVSFVTPTISSARIWLNHGINGGRVGVNAWVKDDETGRKVQTTITSLQYPYSQEWSVMRFDKYDVPTKEKYRGWRTALLVLIIAGVITEREAEKAFGKAHGVVAEFYNMQLQVNRNVRAGLVI